MFDLITTSYSVASHLYEELVSSSIISRAKDYYVLTKSTAATIVSLCFRICTRSSAVFFSSKAYCSYGPTISYVSRHRGGSGCAICNFARSLVGLGGLAFAGLFFNAGFVSSSDSSLSVLVLDLLRCFDGMAAAGISKSSSSALTLREALLWRRGIGVELLAIGELALPSLVLSAASVNKVTRASAVDLRVRRLGMAG